ncbi:hypothetical protein DACRYDRAFT_119714 [Dacryopinax primogenitus]|uniref:AB hydrolase-1 domain-containing protein n=1 Tax=Dacryopinax primogenitus (strain DJM 731) TaxID=1858805 RepID=M5FUH2_DACPD|nr:uncharacterized protein DACRYDRAFT_119714 [Dacryopinax primogenitus]EJT96891.1 hypothetical protein DACRYDRAFT_119714 [Dacryopinax primogenitus]
MSSSFSWSTAELGSLVSGDHPVRLRYGDTHPGRTSQTPYTTIIALHGIGFNSNIWSPWLPHLPQDIRLIALNRRGFGGSSGLHQPQERLVDGTNTESYGRYLLDLLAFVKYAVKVLKLPGKDTKTGKGGIVLLGWSKGCSYLTSILAMLSSAEGLPASLGLPLSTFDPYLNTIRSHVTNVILYEPPGVLFGIPDLERMWDESSTLAEQGRDFVHAFLAMVPAEKVHLVHISVDNMGITGDDLYNGNGKDKEERETLSNVAFQQIPSFIGLSVIYGEHRHHFYVP